MLTFNKHDDMMIINQHGGEKMTDEKKLRSVIEKRGMKLKYVAEQIGLSYYGFLLKLTNKKEFKTSEVLALCELLQIESLKEKEEIFFACKVD